MNSKKLAFYRDVFGGWRWEYFDANGQARDSAFSYDTHAECVADARGRGLIIQRRGLAAGAIDTQGFGRRVSDKRGTGSPVAAVSNVIAA
jgi:hypothetical protein